MRLFTSKTRAVKALYDVVMGIHVSEDPRFPRDDLEREMLDHFYSLCEVCGYRQGPWTPPPPKNNVTQIASRR